MSTAKKSTVTIPDCVKLKLEGKAREGFTPPKCLQLHAMVQAVCMANNGYDRNARWNNGSNFVLVRMMKALFESAYRVEAINHVASAAEAEAEFFIQQVMSLQPENISDVADLKHMLNNHAKPAMEGMDMIVGAYGIMVDVYNQTSNGDIIVKEQKSIGDTRDLVVVDYNKAVDHIKVWEEKIKSSWTLSKATKKRDGN